MAEIQEEQKKWVTPKSIIHFIIALALMLSYYLLINWSLMEVQGLDFFYMWTTGAGGGH